MHSRVTCSDIIAFLEQRDMLARPPVISPALNVVIRGIARDSKATLGEMSWVAARRVDSLPDIVSSFHGSLLICPGTKHLPISSEAVLAYCSAPKEAFALVVWQFFANLTTVIWPDSAMAADAKIGARVKLAPGVCIGQDVTLADDVTVGPNTCLVNTVVGERTSIGANCTIGLPGFGYEKTQAGGFVRFPHVGRVVIGEGVEIGSNTCIDRGALDDTVIGSGVKIDNLVHIAHNVTIGKDALVIAHAMIGGSAHIGDGAWVAPNVAIKNQLSVGPGAVLGMGAVVLRDVPAGATMVGNPARELMR